MTRLLRHESVVELLEDPVPPFLEVRFGKLREPGGPIVQIDHSRWLEMRCPREVKVTVEPLDRAPIVR